MCLMDNPNILLNRRMVDIGMVDIYDKTAEGYVEPVDLNVDELWPLFQVGIALIKIK